MKWMYITFRSVTYAQRARAALEQEGLTSTMIRAPKWMAERGCSYALKLSPETGERAEKLLDAAGRPYLQKYLVDREGKAVKL